MQMFHVDIFRHDKPITTGSYSCRDSARSMVIGHALLDSHSLICVYFAGTKRADVEKIVLLLRQVPQYHDTQINPWATGVGFNGRVDHGVSISGPDAYHAFYWATLLLRAALVTYTPWNTVAQLLRAMPAGEAVDWGLKREHIDAWARVRANTDINSQVMRELYTGPISAYQHRGHTRAWQQIQQGRAAV